MAYAASKEQQIRAADGGLMQIAAAGGAVLFMVCAMRRRGPAQTLAAAALHMRAAWMWAGVAARAVGAVAYRYGECLETARREM
jgi:multisubunit Na+/H+ antiporter MnhB subunit